MNEFKQFPTRITFWQNMPSIHQSAQILSLVDRGFELTIVVEGNIHADRFALGWRTPDFGNARLIISPSQEQITEIAFTHTTETVHLIGGVRGYKLGKTAFEACKRADVHMGLLCEGGNPRGLRGFARRFFYIAQMIKYNKYFDFVLAMGENGVNWYRQSGWPPEKIFPYAYITIQDKNTKYFIAPDFNKPVFELLYVGQLIHRKGVDILLRALQQVNKGNWRLSIAGIGPLQSKYIRMCRKTGIAEHVQFLGALPNSAIKKQMVTADLLVLPSRFDGWGAVVNEALMCGVPVICSDQCGASDLLRADWRGVAFPDVAVSALGTALQRWISRGKNTPELRKRIREWSRCIEGRAAAEYVHQVFEHVYGKMPRPVPPWYEQ